MFEPEREVAGRRIEVRTQAESIDLLDDPSIGPLAGQVEDPGVELEVLSHRKLAVERECLRHVAHALSGRQVVGVNEIAEQLGLAFRRGQQAGEHLHRRGLAAAV